MFPTMEVRWFYPGVAPREVVDWFRRGERVPEEQPRRVDRYLPPGDSDALGIKLREGRFEIKQRFQQRGVVRFHERVAGLVEGWRKVSYVLADPDDGLPGLPVPTSAWIAVQKDRQMRKYQIAPGGKILAVPAEEFPERGCNLELTGVRVGGQQWWSLGFESFGDEGLLWEDLSLAVRHTLGGEAVPTLEAAHSYGYPRWLEVAGQPA